MEQIITFCPKSFVHDNMTGSVELDTKDLEIADSKDIIAKNIKKCTIEIENLEKEEYKIE